MAFRSSSNLANPGGCPALPGNADGNTEIYRFDTTTGCFTQVTSTTGGFNLRPSLNADGTRMAFSSNTTPLTPCPGCPGNPDGNAEIFLESVTAPSPGAATIPTLSEWAQLVMVTVVALGGFLALRRHRLAL